MKNYDIIRKLSWICGYRTVWQLGAEQPQKYLPHNVPQDVALQETRGKSAKGLYFD